MKMIRALLGLSCLVVMRPALAAPLPAEGKFEIVFCYGGDVRIVEHSVNVMGGSSSISGPVRSITEGGVLDRTAASCHNAFTVVQGKINEYGFCELVDTDGDRMFYAFTSDAQGGKWTGYPGTGKFQSYLWQAEWERIRHGAQLARRLGLEVHAGHGLDFETAEAIASLPEIVELNIGHAIIAQALFAGLPAAVREMKALMQAARA